MALELGENYYSPFQIGPVDTILDPWCSMSNSPKYAIFLKSAFSNLFLSNDTFPANKGNCASLFQCSDCLSIVQAFKRYNEGDVMELVDPLMEEVVDAEILSKIFGLAIQCAAPVRSDRPEMKLVAEQLWGIRMDYIRSVKRG